MSQLPQQHPPGVGNTGFSVEVENYLTRQRPDWLDNRDLGIMLPAPVLGTPLAGRLRHEDIVSLVNVV
jgi:hypothetical protein